MRVDQSILRRVLEAVEAAPGLEAVTVPALPGIASDRQRQHVQLLLDGGYLTGVQLRRYRPAFAVGLTVAGQHCLDEMRSGPNIAKFIGECARRVVISASVALLTAKARSVGLPL
jgi:hypothetical protein